MAVVSPAQILGEHRLFRGLAPAYLELLAGCARNEVYKGGEFVFRYGEDADRFYLIREGSVAMEASTAERGVITIQTLGDGDILGFSWLLPPYRYHNDARVTRPARMLSLDGACLRSKCDTDHTLGYELMNRFLPVFADRLKHAELQLMDIYGGRS